MDSETLNKLLAQNLSTLMAEKNLNASAWAKSAGLGHTGVRDIITGKVKNPTYRTLVNLAIVADVDVRRITEGKVDSEIDDLELELRKIFAKLNPTERQFLLNVAKSQLETRNKSLENPAKNSN